MPESVDCSDSRCTRVPPRPRSPIADVLDSLTGYPGLLAWCALSGILVPIPEDVPRAWAGLQIASGDMSWPGALSVAFAGVLLRDGFVFGVGRFAGERTLERRWVQRILPPARIAARGPAAVLVARLSIGVRSATFFTAGAMGVRPRDFLLWDAIGLVVTLPLLTALGYLLGDVVVDTLFWLASQARWVVPLAVLIALGAWWLRREAPAEEP